MDIYKEIVKKKQWHITAKNMGHGEKKNPQETEFKICNKMNNTR